MPVAEHETARPRALLVASETFADGGIQRFNRTFLVACDNLGITCDVLSLGDSEQSRTRWSPPASANIAVFDRNRPRFALHTAAKIATGTYDFIVIGHVNLLDLVIAATKVRRAARVIFIAHGIEVWSDLTGLRRRAIRAVDSLLCVSHYTRQMIQRQVPELPDDRFAIFPNALSESWSRLRSTAGLESAGKWPLRFLLSVTRLDRGDRYKGIITALEAFAMIEDESVHYVVAGRGNDLEFVKGAAERLGVRARVHFAGSVSDAELAFLYRKCLAFLLPSGKEGFGIVFLEAMFFGACVIAARERGAVDVVEHEETGLLVPYGDVVALKRAVDRVVADSSLSRRLSTNARSTVIEDGKFTFTSYVRRLASVLNVEFPGPELVTPLKDPVVAAQSVGNPNETCA